MNSALACLSSNLTRVIDTLAPLKQFYPKKKARPPWIDAELAHLYGKRDAIRRRYKRTGNNNLFQEFLEAASLAEHCDDQARKSFLKGKIDDALQNKKDIWKELKSLGLLPKAKEDLHGFTPAEINAHFTGVSVSPNEYERDANDIVASADEAGFSFKEVTFEDVVPAVSHFSAGGGGGRYTPECRSKSSPIHRPPYCKDMQLLSHSR